MALKVKNEKGVNERKEERIYAKCQKEKEMKGKQIKGKKRERGGEKKIMCCATKGLQVSRDERNPTPLSSLIFITQQNRYENFEKVMGPQLGKEFNGSILRYHIIASESSHTLSVTMRMIYQNIIRCLQILFQKY